LDFAQTETVVILPTYNGERFLREQIRSILSQSYSDFVLHVFDDQSADQTTEIVKEFERSDDRVRLHINPFQKGVIENINDALTNIEADIYFLADQDDVWLPNKMARQMEVLKADDDDDDDDDDVVMTFSDLELIDESGAPLGINFWENQNIDPREAAQVEIIVIKTIVTGCTMAFKKKVLDLALPISKDATMHDHWLSLFAAKIGKIVPVTERLVQYRQHSNNIIGASLTPKQRRQQRYVNCSTYQDFKQRKYQSYRDLLVSIQAFQERLKGHNLDHPFLDKYIVFYKSLIHHQWLIAFNTSTKLKNLPDSHRFLRTLAVTICFPAVYILLKFSQILSKMAKNIRDIPKSKTRKLK
jgi:glycosyltransferase involved in cell wall biosynthesis